MNNKKWLFISALILSLTVLISCGHKDGNSDTGTIDSTDTEAVSDNAIDVGAVGEDGSEEVSDTDTDTSTETPDEETDADTETEATEPEIDPDTGAPEYTNPLTGLAAVTDLSSKRPLAIMINNIKKATPQHGISDGDIIYEILAEGGITRLVMFVTEYEKLGVVGSVRSTRPYYLDYVLGYNAILANAGGSNAAYKKIDSLGMDTLDGVRMNLGNMYYRDSWRRENMGYEHSLMTTGERIVNAINKKKYSTTLDDSYKNLIPFVEYGSRVDLNGDTATHITLQYQKSQTVDLVYDEASEKYLRYQFDGVAHIDANNDKQLAFDNVVILLTSMEVIDEKGHLEVDTTGTGDGYFATGGKYIPIKWSKASNDSPLTITDINGDPVEYNRGKTFVSVFDEDSKCTLDNSSFTPKK